MKVIRPTNNKLTRGYSTGHKGYDFAGLNLPDEVLAGQSGVIVQRVDLYTSNWINNGTLTTKDYGNYIKVKHDDGSFELHAHLKKGSALSNGTRVIAGQVIARIGNTGNSSGKHLHFEVRNSKNASIEVEFITNSVQPPMTDDQTVRNASIKVEVYKQLEIVNPEIASLDDFSRVWAGHKSRITDLQNQLTLAQAEVENKREEISRVRGDLTESEDMREGLQRLIDQKAQEIEKIAREKGELNRLLAECKASTPVEQLTVADVLVLLFNKLRGVKLK